MKKLILILLSNILVFGSMFAQSPEAFKYQAIARSSNGDPLANQEIGIRIQILESSVYGASVYVETHTLTTNEYGLINLSIGMGNAELGSFEDINWGANQYFIEVAVDVNGGSNYIQMGIAQLLSVPYALHAKTAVSSLTEEVDDADADPVNEIQNLLIEDNKLSLTKDTTFIDLSPYLDNTNYWQRTADTIYYNDGNVAIGTDSVIGKLTIMGDTILYKPVLSLIDTVVPAILQIQGNSAKSDGYSALSLKTDENDNQRWRLLHTKEYSGYQANSLAFQYKTDFSNYPAMVLTNSGLAIGTRSTNNYRLNVSGAGYFNSRIDIGREGNYPLNIRSLNQGNAINISNYYDNRNWQMGVDYSGNLNIRSDNDNALSTTFTSIGRLGIGTSNPNSYLSVGGNGSSYYRGSFYYDSDSYSYLASNGTGLSARANYRGVDAYAGNENSTIYGGYFSSRMTNSMGSGDRRAYGGYFSTRIDGTGTSKTAYGVYSIVNRSNPNANYYSGYFRDNNRIYGTYYGLYADQRSGASIDLAEYIYDTNNNLEAADVVIVDPDNDQSVLKSTRAYDSNVAGIISTNPHLVMGMELITNPETGELLTGVNAVQLSLAGRVPVKVIDENGPIKRGDLLTSSSTPGYAMKWTPVDLSQAKDFNELKQLIIENEQRKNAIIGKAVQEHPGGPGKIMVLITLQ